MKTEKVKISQIKSNLDNPRKIDKDKLDRLVKSIQEFPEMLELRPIIVDSEMIVLGGNMRLKAAKKAGLKEVFIIKASELTEQQKREFIIKDNVGFGEWDWDLLESNFDMEELYDWGLDFPEEFEPKKEIIEDDFEIEETEIITDIKLGDKFKIGNHFLICGDSCDKETYNEILGNIKADLIFTDPPYDLEDNYSNLILESLSNDSHCFIMNSDKLLIDNVNNNKDLFRKFFAVDFRQARLVSNNQPMTRVDLVAEFCKGKTKFNNTKDGFSTLIECSKIHNKNESINFGHKQAKKIELPAKFIEHYSNKNEVVFDAFLGSGSTMAACQQLDRICYGIELDHKNCQIIINRMEKVYGLIAEKI